MATDERGKPRTQSTGIMPGQFKGLTAEEFKNLSLRRKPAVAAEALEPAPIQNSDKRTRSPFTDRLMAYFVVEPGEFPDHGEAIPYVKELIEIESDYNIEWNTADDACDVLESQVRRRREELLQIICRDYPETAKKLLLQDLVSPKAEANGAVTGASPGHLERGQRCAQILNEVRQFRYLRVDRGKTVAEIQSENPNFIVWKVRENLTEDDRHVFDYPNQWESAANYGYGLLGKEYNRSWTTTRDGVEAWTRSQETAAKR